MRKARAEAELVHELEQAQRRIAELEAGEARYRSLFADAPLGILVVDSTGQVLEVNEAVLRILDSPSAEATKAINVLSFQPLIQAGVSASLKACLETGTNVTGEYRYTSHWGRTIDVGVRFAPIESQGHGAQIVQVIVEDLTERKAAEAALLENEARFHGTLDAMQEGVLLIGRDWRYLFVNNSAEVQGRRPAAELLGRTVMECWPGIEATDFFHLEQKVMHDRVPAYIEGPFTFPDGETHWFSWNIQPAPEGLLIVTQDITGRRQAESELRASEERFRSLFEKSAVNMLLIEPDSGKIVDANPAASRFYGYSREQLRAMNITDINQLSPEEVAAERQLAKEGKRSHFLFPHCLANGEIRTVEVRSTPVNWAQNTVLFSFIYDVTESFKNQEQLRESQLRTEMAVRGANAGTWDWNVQTGAAVFNERWAEIIGYTLQELEPISMQTWVDLCHPDDLKLSEELLERHFCGETESYECEARLRHKNGAWVWVLDRGKVMEWDAAGKPLRMFGTHLDITESKHAEEQLRASEEKYRSLLASLDSVVVVIDADGTYSYANEVAIRSAGATVENLVGATIYDIFPAEEADANFAAVQHVLRSDLPLTFEGQATIQGHRRWYRTNIFPVHDATGEAAQVLVNTTDIHDLKQIQQELQDLNQSLEERVAERTVELLRANLALERASRAKDEFMANMSHELRTPINGILGMAELLLLGHRGILNERQQAYISAIDTSGRHLLSLINDVLDLSKVQAGKLELNLESFPISDVCHASLAFVKESAVKKGLSIEFVPDPAVTTLRADSRRVKQILVNLLGNAVKFTPAGGSVKLEVHLNRDERRVELSVIDTGIGIAAEDQKRLFSPFTQVDNSMSRSYEGTGLGLVLVKKLAELHGGRVSLESEVGRGSRFTVSLPWTAPDEVPQEPATTQAAATDKTSRLVDRKNLATILLVEDNKTNIMAIGDFLDSLGYSMVYAADGHEALERAVEYAPDLILMDIQMPTMDGLEATRRLRADPQFAATPIIALTARAMAGDRERCLASGATDYLSKPIRLGELSAKIEALLESNLATM